MIDKETLLYRPSTQQYPLTLYDLQKENPTAVFSKEIENSALEEYPFCCFAVRKVIPPICQLGETYVEKLPTLIDGEYIQTYEVVRMSPDDLQTTLAIQKNLILDTLNNKLDSKLNPVIVDGIGIQLREKDLPYISSILSLNLNDNDIVNYRDFNNEINLFTFAQFKQLMTNAFKLRNEITLNYFKQKDALSKIFTLDELNSFTID